MDALSLNSRQSISKPFQCLPLIKQKRTCHLRFAVSCRATTKVEESETTRENFYKMLSLSPGIATMDDIKKAYRSMALQYHPDVCHDPEMKEESTRMFVQLNAAYETLSNPMLRAQYDSELGLKRKNNMEENNAMWRNRWQEQVVELKNRSRRRMEQKGGSWGTRMRRTQNIKDI